MGDVITLTTDFGTREGFAAQMKGVILAINPHVQLVDVTHDIQPFDIMEGSLVLKELHRYFPIGTVHVGVIDPGVGSNRRGIVVKSREHFFVGPDNGLFSWLLAPEDTWEVREIQNPKFTLQNPHPTFHGRDIFAPVAGHLSLGKGYTLTGPLVDDPVIRSTSQVRKTASGIEGEVIHVDRFGNLYSNIGEEMLTTSVKAVRVGNTEIKCISHFFSEVPEGQALALVNSFGLLEIAINGGNAGRVLGINTGYRVSVDWA